MRQLLLVDRGALLDGLQLVLDVLCRCSQVRQLVQLDRGLSQEYLLGGVSLEVARVPQVVLQPHVFRLILRQEQLLRGDVPHYLGQHGRGSRTEEVVLLAILKQLLLLLTLEEQVVATYHEVLRRAHWSQKSTVTMVIVVVRGFL